MADAASAECRVWQMQAQLRQGQEAVIELGKEADEIEIGRGNESTDDEELPVAHCCL